jgi:hypothetical protein
MINIAPRLNPSRACSGWVAFPNRNFAPVPSLPGAFSFAVSVARAGTWREELRGSDSYLWHSLAHLFPGLPVPFRIHSRLFPSKKRYHSMAGV